MTIAPTSDRQPQDTLTGSQWRAALPWLIAFALLLALPFVFRSSSAITVMNQMAITVIFALSYNMLLGQGGMLSFGHAVYMGLGGFFAVHVMNTLLVPLPLLPLFGGLFGLIFAIIVGAFSTRRAGTVFAMISLGVGELVAASSIIIVSFFGGEAGVKGDRTEAPAFLGINFASQTQVYYLIAAWMFLSALAMYLFTRTPAGRMANAVRDNEERAEFLGYSQRTVRFMSFCAAGFFAGIAGALIAINFEILTEENLNLTSSGVILLVTFLGGVGFFIGPIVGAVAFTLLQSVLSLQTDLWQLYVGLLFLLAVMFFPGGLTGVLAMHGPAWRHGKLGLLTVPYLKLTAVVVTGILAAACFLEILFHVRHASVGENTMRLFKLTIDTHAVWPWLATGGVALICLALANRLAPDVKAAWDAANLPAKGSARR
ncbi:MULTISPECIES: branched-chain amino acid ABC transporter permease [Rhodomicrobium]|uniref:branched-chain amino acid ABC transporter permease n=1 Tax=Rhodomicrobium TaxID=1068 RepID=UPI000B4A8CF2|nr:MULTISPECIES: branched-chain amino acid ABC transporter permease [Rhodomicrobium]